MLLLRGASPLGCCSYFEACPPLLLQVQQPTMRLAALRSNHATFLITDAEIAPHKVLLPGL